MRVVEAIISSVQLRRAVIVLDEYDNIIEVDQELEDLNEKDLELEEVLYEFRQEKMPEHREVG